MATIPVTATKAVGDKVSAAWANNNVEAPIDFAYSPPRCQVFTAAGQNFADGVQTAMIFDGEAWDTDNMHDNVTNNTRVTINTDGLYEVTVYGDLPSGVTYTQFDVQIRINGTTSVRTMNFVNPAAGIFRFTLYREFTAGTYLEFLLTQTSGAARTGGTGNNVQGATVLRVCNLS